MYYFELSARAVVAVLFAEKDITHAYLHYYFGRDTGGSRHLRYKKIIIQNTSAAVPLAKLQLPYYILYTYIRCQQ